MLGKLMKHEVKSTYKMGCLMLMAIGLITVFGWLAFQTPMWKSLSRNDFSFGWMDVFGFLTLMMYVLLLVGVNYGILIYLGVHFYKTMYTDEGYLTHTLPATKNQILGSKILVGSLWMVFETLAVIASLLILGVTMLAILMPKGFTLSQMWGEFSDFMGQLPASLGFDTIGWLIKMAVMSLFTSFTTVIILFGAISLGQLFSRHRLLMAILCYIGIMIAENLLSTLLRSLTFSVYRYMDTSMNINFICNLFLAVGLYFVSYYVNSRKLNLQ